jgi:hypothetical protein
VALGQRGGCPDDTCVMLGTDRGLQAFERRPPSTPATPPACADTGGTPPTSRPRGTGRNRRGRRPEPVSGVAAQQRARDQARRPKTSNRCTALPTLPASPAASTTAPAIGAGPGLAGSTPDPSRIRERVAALVPEHAGREEPAGLATRTLRRCCGDPDLEAVLFGRGRRSAPGSSARAARAAVTPRGENGALITAGLAP